MKKPHPKLILGKIRILQWIKDHWIAIATLVVGALTLSIMWFNYERSYKLSYSTSSAQLRPIVEVPSRPILVDANVGWFMAHIDLVKYDSIDIRQYIEKVTLNARLPLVNTSQYLARVSAVLWMDTLSGDDRIRSVVEGSQDPSAFHIDSSQRYYNLPDIAPGRLAHIPIRWTVHFLENNSFTLHFLFFYRNDAGVLYDTYSWARYELNSVVITKLRQEGNQFDLSMRPSQIEQLIAFKDSSWSSKSYSEAEAEHITKLLNLK